MLNAFLLERTTDVFSYFIKFENTMGSELSTLSCDWPIPLSFSYVYSMVQFNKQNAALLSKKGQNTLLHFQYSIIKVSNHRDHALECSANEMKQQPSTLIKKIFFCFWLTIKPTSLILFGGCMTYTSLKPKRHSTRKERHTPTMFPRGSSTLKSRGILTVGFN